MSPSPDLLARNAAITHAVLSGISCPVAGKPYGLSPAQVRQLVQTVCRLRNPDWYRHLTDTGRETLRNLRQYRQAFGFDADAHACLTMLPCPFCQSPRVEGAWIIVETKVWLVRCQQCHARGPERGTLEDAAAAWNTAARAPEVMTDPLVRTTTALVEPQHRG